MKKILLILGGAVFVLGIGIFFAAFAMADFDFEKLGTRKYKSSTVEVKEAFGNIKVDCDTADIEFKPGLKTSVDLYLEKDSDYKVEVKNNTLYITEKEKNHWFNVSFTSKSQKITVYTALNEYNSINITGDTGNISFDEGYSFQTADMKTDTGDIHMSDIKILNKAYLKTDTGNIMLNKMYGENLKIETDTGDVDLINVVAQGSMNIETDTGDVTFDKCDAGEMSVRTDTGDVTGTLLSEKNFRGHSDTGKTKLPKTGSGGTCDLSSNTGDLVITIDD